MYAEPEIGQLNYLVVPRIKAYWKDVAYRLGYKIHTVQAIKESNKGNPKGCCLEFFENWLTTKNGASAGPKTWSTLMDALEKVEELAAVREEILKDLLINTNILK